MSLKSITWRFIWHLWWCDDGRHNHEDTRTIFEAVHSRCHFVKPSKVDEFKFHGNFQLCYDVTWRNHSAKMLSKTWKTHNYNRWCELKLVILVNNVPSLFTLSLSLLLSLKLLFFNKNIFRSQTFIKRMKKTGNNTLFSHNSQKRFSLNGFVSSFFLCSVRLSSSQPSNVWRLGVD